MITLICITFQSKLFIDESLTTKNHFVLQIVHEKLGKVIHLDDADLDDAHLGMISLSSDSSLMIHAASANC